MAGPKVAASWTTTAARMSALGLCALLGLGAARHDMPTVAAFLAGLLALALLGHAPLPPLSLRLLTLLEAALWAWGVLATGADQSPLLPYLLAPVFVAGLRLGLDGVLVPVAGAAVAVLSAAPATVANPRVGHATGVLAQWVALSLVVGLLAVWVRTLELRDAGETSYLYTYRLLAELRAVARRLPTGLDRTAVAEALLREVRVLAPQAPGAAVFVRSQGNWLTLAATWGEPPHAPEARLDADTILTEAWSGQHPLWADDVLVLPLVAGDRTTGLLLLGPLQRSAIDPGLEGRLAGTVRDGAMRLETALLFDELREVATVEERHRLAREIHDGIAQDLAAFGYQLDGLAREVSRDLDRERVAGELLQVRKQLGVLVGELRQSIFELRTDAGNSQSLGGALGEFARAVAVSNGMTVHVDLDESTTRLPADVEAELLRIGQEAVNNSRKHAQAQNLWIRCEVSPPFALLVVADDGVGQGTARADSFGLQIMRERAARLRATLELSAREPQGTIVRCEVGRR